MVAIDTSALGSAAHPDHTIREYRPTDLVEASALLARTGGRVRVRRGSLVDTAILPGLVACSDAGLHGVVTFQRRRSELDLVVVAADPLDDDTRRALLTAALDEVAPDCRRVVACTSNADFALQRSLQIAGFRLCAVRAGSIETARARVAPGRLPESLHGVPLSDEIEFELTPN